MAHVLEKDSVQLQKAAGPEEVRHIVVASVQPQIPVVDSEGAQTCCIFIFISLLNWASQRAEKQKQLKNIKHGNKSTTVNNVMIYKQPHKEEKKNF